MGFAVAAVADSVRGVAVTLDHPGWSVVGLETQLTGMASTLLEHGVALVHLLGAGVDLLRLRVSVEDLAHQKQTGVNSARLAMRGAITGGQRSCREVTIGSMRRGVISGEWKMIETVSVARLVTRVVSGGQTVTEVVLGLVQGVAGPGDCLRGLMYHAASGVVPAPRRAAVAAGHRTRAVGGAVAPARAAGAVAVQMTAADGAVVPARPAGEVVVRTRAAGGAVVPVRAAGAGPVQMTVGGEAAVPARLPGAVAAPEPDSAAGVDSGKMSGVDGAEAVAVADGARQPGAAVVASSTEVVSALGPSICRALRGLKCGTSLTC